MTSFVSHTYVDRANADELSEWWKQLLGSQDVEVQVGADCTVPGGR